MRRLFNFAVLFICVGIDHALHHFVRLVHWCQFQNLELASRAAKTFGVEGFYEHAAKRIHRTSPDIARKISKAVADCP